MDIRESIRSQSEVALSLSAHILATAEKTSNIVLSPTSMYIVLSMIAEGSDGATKDQLLSFLKSKSTEHLNALASQLVSVILADGSGNGGPLLSVFVGMWIDKSVSFKPSFKQVAETAYNAAAYQVDFSVPPQALDDVNSWVGKHTNGLIKDILPSGSVDSTTKLVVANAIYFKGAWTEKFDASKTKGDNFHLLDGSSVQVPFMTSKKKQFIGAYDGFKVLGLPYQQGEDKRRFTMYFCLPDAKDGLPDLLKKIDLDFVNRHIPSQQVEVGELKVPRFKITYGFEAATILKVLGLSLPFSGEASLTEMVDGPEATAKNLSISNFFHKSVIEVNEDGTEAASTSAAVIKLRSIAMVEKIDFVADHPFCFVIREDLTGMVLFVGQVLNPLEADN